MTNHIIFITSLSIFRIHYVLLVVRNKIIIHNKYVLDTRWLFLKKEKRKRISIQHRWFWS